MPQLDYFKSIYKRPLFPAAVRTNAAPKDSDCLAVPPSLCSITSSSARIPLGLVHAGIVTIDPNQGQPGHLCVRAPSCKLCGTGGLFKLNPI